MRHDSGDEHRRGVARDGSSVDLYRVLPPRGEPELIKAVVPAGGSILDLGSGTGRIAHPLVALGYEVVAVDESAEMLAHVRGAQTVCCDIRDLHLARRFDAVLLTSNLINNPDPDTRAALLACCRRHVADGGLVLAERRTAEWFDATAAPLANGSGGGLADGITITMGNLRRAGDLLSGTLTYGFGDRQWQHDFTVARLSDDDLDELLRAAGLRRAGWLSPKRSWFSARPLPLPGGAPENPATGA
ncbi:MAG TPA: class I SAM-dependent methyltransferase [Mycobacteriales bacterium]|nr:class I SAM-dependent methyltransferase [Mycobacteriales bacterium]